jgi:hypothetical protein
MTQKEQNNSSLILKNINSRDFLTFGIHNVAYVKPVIVENKMAYAIHAADGTPLSVMGDFSAAVGLILNNELEPVTLH